MIPSKRNNTALFVFVIPALLIIAALYVLGATSLFNKPSVLVTPAELRAREAHRANWGRIPVTEAAQPGMSPHAITVYTARMERLAAAQQASSSLQSANAAYSARLTGLAMVTAPQRANRAYSARWQAFADHTPKDTGK